MNLTILVSTFNRARDLERFLASLAGLKPKPGRTWELVLVDNNSTDDTAAVVKAAPPLPGGAQIKYVFEARQGKSYGLNSGLAVASGAIVAFTDDDIVLPDNWLDAIIDYFDAHPNAGCVGGMVRLYDPADAPVCIRLSTRPDVVDASGFSAGNIPIMGCNMAMRAEVLRQVGEFDTDIGPGSKVGVAEDLDYLYRVVNAGHPIHYAPEIALFHNHGRRTPSQLERLTRGYLLGRGAFYCKYILRRDRTVARWAYWECMRHLGLRSLRAPFDGAVRSELKDLWLLIEGALMYCRYRQRPAAAARA